MLLLLWCHDFTMITLCRMLCLWRSQVILPLLWCHNLTVVALLQEEEGEDLPALEETVDEGSRMEEARLRPCCA